MRDCVGNKRRGRTRARPKVADRQAAEVWFGTHPIGRDRKPLGQERDVKHVPSVDSLVTPKQVEQQSTEPRPLQPLGHEAVAGAQAAAAAPMSKKNKAAALLGADQGSAEAKRRKRDLYLKPTTAMAQGSGRVLILC